MLSDQCCIVCDVQLFCLDVNAAVLSQLVLMMETCLFAMQVEPATFWVLCPIQPQFYVVFLSTCPNHVFLSRMEPVA